MARKSNKTSHVLHLLAGEEPVPEAPEEKAAAPAAAKEEAPTEENQKPAQPPEEAPNVSIISTGTSEGDALADLIKDQLEEAFPEELLNPPSDSAVPDERPDIAKFGTADPADAAERIEAQPVSETSAEPAAAQTEGGANEPNPQNDEDAYTDKGNGPTAPEPLTDISGDPKPLPEMANSPERLSEMADSPTPLSEMEEMDDRPKPQEEPSNASDALTPAPEDNPTTAAPVPDTPDEISAEDETTAPQSSDSNADQTEETIPGQTTNIDETNATQTSDTPTDQEPELPADAGQTPDASFAANETNDDVQEPEAAPQTKQPAMSRAHLDSVLYPDKDAENHNYQFVNVMEYIIKDMVIDYMKKFDMCTCERCVVDTTALALTYCPAKYIVVDKHSVSPLLNYYSNRYVGDVTVELTKACILVKENPRH